MSKRDLSAEIKIKANADGVEAGVAKAKRSLSGLGEAARKVGEDAGKGLDDLSKGGATAGATLDRVTRSVIASVQRQTAALEAGGVATRGYQESIARMRGADLGALKPYLDQLDAARSKANAAAAAQGSLIDRLGAIGPVANLARAHLATLVGSVTIGGILAFVKGVNDGVDALNDIRDATGSTIQNISALEDIGKRTGASLEIVSSTLIKFNDLLSQAGPKSPITAQLQAIGLSADELRKMDPAEALRVTAVALAGYADDANKARLIQDLFGKSVKEAAPYLADLAKQGSLVAKVTQEQADEADRFNTQLSVMSAHVSTAERALAGPLVKAINDTVAAFREGTAAGMGFWAVASKRISDNTKAFWGGSSDGAAGGATGSWGDPPPAAPAAKPSVVAPKSTAEIAAEAAAAKAAVDARLAEIRRGLAMEVLLTRGALDEIASLRRSAQMTEREAIEQTAAAEVGQLERQRARLADELSAYAKQADAVKEVAALKGQLRLVDEEIAQRRRKEIRDLDELIRRQREAASGAQIEQRQGDQADIAAQERQRLEAFNAALTAVNEYGRGIDQANAAASFELTLLGKSEVAREKALAQYRIQIDLERELDRIRRDTKLDASDQDWLSDRARAAAARASSGVDAKVAQGSITELDKFLDPARAKDFGAALSDAFGEAGDALAQLTNALQGYAQQQAEIAKMQDRLESSKGSISQAEYIKRETALASKSAQAQVSSYAALSGAAKGFFSEHSKGYKAMEGAEKAFRVVEIGLALESMARQLFAVNAVTGATVAAESTKASAVASGTAMQVAADQVKGQSAAAVGIATQAQGDPYTALPRMGIIAGAMAALGFVVGWGGGGGSTSAVRESRQASQGTGTVFGDADAKSNSLGDAFGSLEDSARLELRYQSGMLSALRSIEGSMAGVANAVLRTQGITSGNSVGVFEGVLSVNTGDPILNAMGLGGDKLASSLPGIGGVISKLQSLWGKTKQEITDSGLTISGMVAELMQGQGFGQYADVTTTKSSFFGLSKSSSSSTILGDLDADTSAALARVFRGLSSALVDASGALGRDADQVSQQLAATLVDIPRVSLRDLKGDELQQAIASTISAAADTMGQQVVPGLDLFQQVGEGYFETIVRVSAGIESAGYALERFGIAAIDYQAVANKQGEVASEIFRDSVVAHEGAGRQITEVVQGISGSVDDLVETYRGLEDVRGLLRSVGARGDDPGYDLLRGAGGLDALRDGLESYLEGFFSETERYAAANARLAEEFQRLGIAQPQSIEAYRDLASGLDQADAASAHLFGQLMAVADAYYTVADAERQSRERMQSAYDGVAGDWLDGDALRAYRADRVREQLDSVGLDISAEAILGASAETWRALYDAIDTGTQAGREQATALLQAWTDVRDMHDEVSRAAQQAAAAQDDMLAALRRATSAETTGLQATASAAREALSTAEQLISMLGNNIASLRGSAAPAGSAEAARQFIDLAESAARRTGYLPDSAELASAVSAALAGMDQGNYASASDKAFDQLVLAGQLESLQDVAGKQKTVAERQLDAATRQIDYLSQLTDQASAQLDALRGVNASVMTVGEALDAFMRTPSGGGGGGGSSASFGGGSTVAASGATGTGGGYNPANGYRREYIATTTAGRSSTWVPIIDMSEMGRLADIKKVVDGFDGTGDLVGLLTSVKAAGGTLSDLQVVGGYTLDDWRRAAASVDIPAFANGGQHSGGWAMVGERGPELAYMPPARIYTSSDTGAMLGGSVRIERLLESIDKRLVRLEALEGIQSSTADLAEQFYRVTENGNGMRVEVMAPIPTE